MPPLIVAAGVVMAGVAAVRLYRAITEKVAADLDVVRHRSPVMEGTRLVRDPISGEYRPDRRPS